MEPSLIFNKMRVNAMRIILKVIGKILKKIYYNNKG